MREPREQSELFCGLVRRHHQAVWRSAWRIVRDPADADDVTQEVFLHALRRPDDLARARDPEHVLRWLAVKTALARLRGDRHRRRREEDVAMVRSERIEGESPERREQLAAVRREVDELPDALRLATVLRFQEGLSFAQVGECLGIAEPTAFERVKKALERLRLRLAEVGPAGALAQLEGLLAVPESVTAPAALATKLLALGATAGVGATAASASGAGASVVSSKLVAAVLAIVLLGGGSALAWKLQRAPEPSVPASAAATRASESDPTQDAAVRAGDPSRAAPTRSSETREDAGANVPGDGERAPARGRIEGSLVDESGRPVAGAQVEANGWVAGKKGETVSATATSDDHGAFALDLPIQVDGRQACSLLVRHADFLAHRTERLVAEADRTLETGAITIRRNTADRAGEFALEVVVLDRAGRPVEGAIVRLTRRLSTMPETFEGEAGGVTNASGTIRLEGSRIGAKSITIEARRLGFRPLREKLELEWTGFQERTFTLEPGLVLAGRLVFPDGADVKKETLGEDVPRTQLDDLPRPVQQLLPHGATVHRGGSQVYALADDPGRDPTDWLHAELAADGSFRIIGLDPGTYTLHVRSSCSPAALFEVEAGREDLVIALKRSDDERDVGVHLGEIHGRLIDAATGAPVAAAHDTVECALIEVRDAEEFERDELPLLASPIVAPRQVSVPFGWVPPPPSPVFHLTGLDAGSYVVVARVAGHAPAVSAPLRVERNGFVKDVVLRLEQPATASGRVVDESGRPIEGALVLPIGTGPRSKQRIESLDETIVESGVRGLWYYGLPRTDADGRFELSGLAPGIDFAIAAIHPKFAPAATDPREFAPATREAVKLQMKAR